MKGKYKRLVVNRIVITVVLILLQIVWFVFMLEKLARYSSWITTAFTALSIAIVLYIIGKDDNSAYKIGWIVLIMTLPLFGGLLSLIVMRILLKAEGRFCSLFGVSVGGAAAHNIGQMAAAVIWLKNWAVIAYLPFLLVMSVPLGLVTGLTCSVVLHHLKKIDFSA